MKTTIEKDTGVCRYMTTAKWENVPHAPPKRTSGIYRQFASLHYGWSTLHTARKISKMPLFSKGYTGTPGRLVTLNLSYAFIGLCTSNIPHIDKLLNN